MAKLEKENLKNLFETGDIPTGDDFADLIDSTYNESTSILDNITQSNNLPLWNGAPWPSTGISPDDPTLIAAVIKRGMKAYNPTFYGAVCDGVTDDTVAYETMLTDIGNSNAYVYIPGPSILMRQLSMNRALSFKGISTNHSHLIWPAEATSRGLKFLVPQDADYNSTKFTNQCIELTDLALLSGGDGDGDAVNINGSSQIQGGMVVDRYSPRLFVDKVITRGILTANSWHWGFNLVDLHNPMFKRYFHIGCDIDYTKSNGLSWTGTGFPVVLNIESCMFYFTNKAVLASGLVEAAYINNGEIVGCIDGFIFDVTNRPMLKITNYHVATHHTAVRINDGYECDISHNLFYFFDPSYVGESELIGVHITGNASFCNTISNNKFNFIQGNVPSVIGAAIRHEGWDNKFLSQFHHNTYRASAYSRGFFLDVRGGSEESWATNFRMDNNHTYSCEGDVRTTAMAVV